MYLQVEILKIMEACKDPWRQADQATVVEVQGVQPAQTQEGVRSDGLQVPVVAEVELLQAVEAVKGRRLYVGDVVGVKPQHGGGG